MYALIQHAEVWQLFEEDPRLPQEADVRDVSKVKSIAVGWKVRPDGGFEPPPAADDGSTAVPIAVSSAQAKIALKRAGYLPAVRAAIEALGEDDEAALWFAEARTWERSNAYVAQIGEAIGLTSEQIDDLFRQAGQIAA